MQNIRNSILGLLALVVSFTPFAVYAASVTVQNLTPSASIVAKSNVSFNIVGSGFSASIYYLTDSFPNSSASLANVDPGGKFSWTPVLHDVGAHILTVSITDNDGNLAQSTQTITVLPPPSITAQNVSPAGSLMPGTKFTFSILANGLTNPKYIVGDSFASPSVSSDNMDSAGNFSWTPDPSQNGEHTITVYANDDAGHSATMNVSVRVGAGPTIAIGSVNPPGNIKPGQTVSFAVSAVNFVPTAFSVTDAFPGTSLSNANINLSGLFSWTPNQSDAGVHNVILMGQVGAFGAIATTTQKIMVLGLNGEVPGQLQATVVASTTPSISNLALVALQAQLVFLQSKMGTSSGTAIVSPTTVAFASYLKPGMSGDEVRKLQDFLAKLGLLTATPNGYYGAGTTEAVKKFQTAHKLDALGMVGPATRAALNQEFSPTPGASSTPATAATSTGAKFLFEHFMGVGDDDPDVLELQKSLSTLGYLSSSPTGYYGGVTESAVKKFQIAKGIIATGYVGRETRTELNR